MSKRRAHMFRRGLAVIALGAAWSASLIALTSPASAAPPATSLALLRRNIEQRVDQGPKHRLRKADLRPGMKVVMRLLDRCYAKALLIDPNISGVVNTGLTIRNDPTLGISLTVTGFDTDGRLGKSKQFLSCVTTTLESNVLPPLPTLGEIGRAHV